jgi:hypothetical protein
LSSGEQLVGVEAGLDRLGELNLLGRVEQRRTADLVEVGADQVAVGHRGVVVTLDGGPLYLLVRNLRHRHPI